MASKNGNAAADEARGVLEFDLLASGVDRENNSTSESTQAASSTTVTVRGPAAPKGRPRFRQTGFDTARRKSGNTRPMAVWPLSLLWATNRQLALEPGLQIPLTISSITAATPGIRSSISPGRSCPSRAAIGRPSVTQCEERSRPRLL